MKLTNLFPYPYRGLTQLYLHLPTNLAAGDFFCSHSPKVHHMSRKILPVMLLLSLFLLHVQPATAGAFRDALFDGFCRDLPYSERIGCNGYLQYRIQRGKSRDQALETCLWGCGEVLSDPTKVPDCRKGCLDANALDN